MTWNWLGWLLWFGLLVYFCWVVHYIRVKQLMLIAKTGRRVDKQLMIKYCLHLLVVLIWLGGMSYLTFGRQVDYTNTREVSSKTTYHTLQLSSSGSDYYYVKANRSDNGNHIVSYTYETSDKKNTVSARYAAVADDQELILADAKKYPWNLKRLEQEDSNTSHAFVAEMTVTYKNTVINGMGLRANHPAGQYTLLRVPASNLVK